MINTKDALQRQLRDTPGTESGPQTTRFVVVGTVGFLVLALLGMAIAPVAASPGATQQVPPAPTCDLTSLAFVSVGGQLEFAREDHAMSFSGANERVVTIDSAIAGHPVAEAHAMSFSGADEVSLAVDSSIAGHPVAEAHAMSFSDADALALDSSIAGYPVAEVHAMSFSGADEDTPTVGSVFFGC